MLKTGEAAPEFEAPTSQGSALKLSSLRGHPVVLYFFPKADTPGCTIESKAFRDLQPEFDRRQVRVVGVSVDELPAQEAFAKKCALPFPLVADPSKAIARAYGVLGPSGVARRVTFLLGTDGKVVDVVDAGAPDPHVARARSKFLGP